MLDCDAKSVFLRSLSEGDQQVAKRPCVDTQQELALQVASDVGHEVSVIDSLSAEEDDVTYELKKTEANPFLAQCQIEEVRI